MHHYDLDLNNDIGAPYILMDYINGAAASELRRIKNCDRGLFGTAEQDQKFRQQMAKIQVELSTFNFDRIGGLYQDEQSSEFFIGPELMTGKGPWTSPMDFYIDLADHAMAVCATETKPEVHEKTSFAVPVLFKELISYVYQSRQDPTGASFRLTNRDFGAHNLLVNDDFDIIGVIDFDGDTRCTSGDGNSVSDTDRPRAGGSWTRRNEAHGN